MRTSIIKILFIFCTISFSASAQKEAAIWSLGNGKQLNFQNGDFEYKDLELKRDLVSTICDKQGNLLLYSDGKTVWDKNNEVLINGDDLMENNRVLNPGSRPFFVPYPKKEGFYFLIYETVPKGGYNFKDKYVVYTEINANGQSGFGEVIQKNVKIHENYHHSPTIAGYCNNSYYWLLVDENYSGKHQSPYPTDKICFYKIDENGISTNPSVNVDLYMGHSSSYKFSPNGDKFFFYYYENGNPNGYFWSIADFNFKTGKLYNIRGIPFKEIWNVEFSPNSRMLYFFEKNNLIQLEVGFFDDSKFNYKADTIVSVWESSAAENSISSDLQLAPDGKIYFYYYDISNKTTKLGRINSPNYKGIACNVETDLPELDENTYPFFPEFVTSLFRDTLPEKIDEFIPDAGPEIEICANVSEKIGVSGQPDAYYQWLPNGYFENPFSSETNIFLRNPVFPAPQNNEVFLIATDGNCWMNMDKTNVKVLPSPNNLPVDGSWSVCPFVEEVDYWAYNASHWFDSNETELKWIVEGGEIDSIVYSDTDTVKINWFETNSNAVVGAYAINQFQCISDTSLFPVRINVELITQTPKGPDRVCIAQGQNLAYQIRNTNGSVYDWKIEGGEIVKGQGSHKIEVNWLEAGKNSLTVHETSITIDTVCFGESLPLEINVINDSLSIEFISVSVVENEVLELHFLSDKIDRSNHELFAVIDNGINTREIKVDIDDSGKTKLPGIDLDQAYQIVLKVKNLCNEFFFSNFQETIFLAGWEQASREQIFLHWNNNSFWERDELRHEIWYAGEQGVWQKIDEVEGLNEYNFPLNYETRTHVFRIKETNLTKNLESWSNKIAITVEDKLFVPNVFTPNGDGINDTWQIQKIQFHSFNKLTIYNKSGEQVFTCKSEFVPWDGKIDGRIHQGVYFYQLEIEGEKTRYGQLTVIQ